MIGFDYSEKYLRSILNKIYYGRVKKSNFLFSCHFQIDKKLIMLKKIQREKTDSNFGFSQAASCL